MTTFTLTTDGQNAACDGFVDALDGTGGTPTLVIATATSGTDIVTIPLAGATAFGDAASGVATVTTANQTGTATSTGSKTAARFRLMTEHATTPVKLGHGDVGSGTGTASMTISSTTIGNGDTITLTTMTVTMPAS